MQKRPLKPVQLNNGYLETDYCLYFNQLTLQKIPLRLRNQKVGRFSDVILLCFNL